MKMPPQLSDYRGKASVKASWPKQMHNKEVPIEVEHLWIPVG